MDKGSKNILNTQDNKELFKLDTQQLKHEEKAQDDGVFEKRRLEQRYKLIFRCQSHITQQNFRK